MNEFDSALKEYEKTFDDIVPMAALSGYDEKEIISMINRCIKEGKDLYDIGILSLDETY